MLEQLFASTARVKVLALLLLNANERYYQREIAELTDLPIRAVQRETTKMVDFGLLRREADGNRAYYQARRDFFLFPELRDIFLKTIGLSSLLDQALRGSEQVQSAFIFGSYAANRETTASDIDLLVVGEISARELSAALQPAQMTIQREVNYVLYSADEFRRQAQESGFLRNVLAGPKLFLIGDEDDLQKLTT